MIPTYLADPTTSNRIYLSDGEDSTDGQAVLITGTVSSVKGVFKPATRTTAGTTIISSPIPGGSIQVTGFVLSTAKGAGQTTTLQFTDGTNTEAFVIVDMDLAFVSQASFADTRVQGWVDARIEIITSGVADATVVLYYVKHKDSETYSAWDAKR